MHLWEGFTRHATGLTMDLGVDHRHCLFPNLLIVVKGLSMPIGMSEEINPERTHWKTYCSPSQRDRSYTKSDNRPYERFDSFKPLVHIAGQIFYLYFHRHKNLIIS